MNPLRQLLRKPSHWLAITVFAACLSAVGIVFSALYGMVWGDIGYRNPDQLITLHNRFPAWNLPYSNVSIPDFIDYKNEIPGIESAAVFRSQSANLRLRADQPAQRLEGALVSHEYFTTLGRPLVLGRAFTADDVRSPDPAVVILSHAAWQRYFGGDPAILTRDVELQGRIKRVIGVLADRPEPNRRVGTEFYAPLHISEKAASAEEREYGYWNMIARKRPGVSDAAIESASKALFERWVQSASAERKQQFYSEAQGTAVQPIREYLFGEALKSARYLLLAMLCLLAMACANIANVLSAGVLARSRDLAIRSALGASQQSLLRGIVGESLALAWIGALIALIVVYSTRSWLELHLLGDGSMLRHSFAWVVLGTLLAASVSGIIASVFAMKLAARIGGSAEQALNTKVSANGNSTARNVLTSMQVAIAIALLFVGLSLVREFDRIESARNGFNAENVQTFRVDLNNERYRDPAQTQAFAENFDRELRALPNIESVALAQHLPFNGDDWGSEFQSEESNVSFNLRMVLTHPGLFNTLSIPLRAGRDFNFQDRQEGSKEAPKVIVIDEQAALDLFGRTDVVGNTVRREDERLHVIGVVGNVERKQPGLSDNVGTVYFPIAQLGGTGALHIAIKLQNAKPFPLTQIRQRLAALDTGLAMYAVQPLDQLRQMRLQPQRMISNVSGALAGFALALAMIGTFGVLALAIGARHGEFGLRQALGADRAGIATLVLRSGGRLVGFGVLLAVPCAWALLQAARTMLPNLAAFDRIDSGVLIFTLAIVVLSTLLACALPIWRASRVSPLAAMR